MFPRPLTIPCFIWCTCSNAVGIRYSPIQNLISLSMPFTTEVPRDLSSLMFILALLILSCNFPSYCLVHAVVVVSIVNSTMYTLINGRQNPAFVRSSPTLRSWWWLPWPLWKLASVLSNWLRHYLQLLVLCSFLCFLKFQVLLWGSEDDFHGHY